MDDEWLWGKAFISLQRPLKVQLKSVKADWKLFFVRNSFTERSEAKQNPG